MSGIRVCCNILLQVIRAPTECDWRIVEFQRAMQQQNCPTIVYSRDWDFAAHMCPLIASLQRRCAVKSSMTLPKHVIVDLVTTYRGRSPHAFIERP